MGQTAAAKLVLTLAFVAALLSPAAGDWNALVAGGSGRGTIYGAGQNSNGACSYGKNMADTTGLPWSSPASGASDGGTGQDMTFVALNHVDYEGGTACGSCIWFRGTGDGVGVQSRKISGDWQYGFVDNICPECPKGALDLARSYTVGDGIWNVEWFAVPCQVGSSNLQYSFPQSSPYYFNMVVSNSRVPVASVTASINGVDLPLTRTSNNQWAYHNSHGPYTFPMKVTVKPVCGAAVTDTIKSVDGGSGTAQFGTEGCSSKGDPTTGSSGTGSNGAFSTEATSATRATNPGPPPTSQSQARAIASPTVKAAASSSTQKPTHTPTRTSTSKLSPEPTPRSMDIPTPTKAPSDASPTSKASLVACCTSPALLSCAPMPVAQTQAGLCCAQCFADELYGGYWSKDLGKAVVPGWYQCGSTQGKYPSIVCGDEGFDCVYMSHFYWQCRNDGGGPSAHGRRRLRTELRGQH